MGSPLGADGVLVGVGSSAQPARPAACCAGLGARAPNATFDLSVWRVTSGWPGCLGCSSGCQRVSFDVGKRALLGGEQGTPGQQPKSARLCWPRGDTSPTSGFPTGQRRPQDSTRTAREASSPKNQSRDTSQIEEQPAVRCFFGSPFSRHYHHRPHSCPAPAGGCEVAAPCSATPGRLAPSSP